MMMIASGVEVVDPSLAQSTMIPTCPPSCAHHSHHTPKVHGVSQCRLIVEASCKDYPLFWALRAQVQIFQTLSPSFDPVHLQVGKGG